MKLQSDRLGVMPTDGLSMRNGSVGLQRSGWKRTSECFVQVEFTNAQTREREELPRSHAKRGNEDDEDKYQDGTDS